MRPGPSPGSAEKRLWRDDVGRELLIHIPVLDDAAAGDAVDVDHREPHVAGTPMDQQDTGVTVDEEASDGQQQTWCGELLGEDRRGRAGRVGLW